MFRLPRLRGFGSDLDVTAENDIEALTAGLARALARAGLSQPERLERLTGGANMESWRFVAGARDYVLRRAPSAALMADRPFGHDTEAAIIRAARAAGVAAPEIVVELEAGDAIGSGFVMRAIPGTPDPRAILEGDDPGTLLADCARELAKTHAVPRQALPRALPEPSIVDLQSDLGEQFAAAGGDRPIIALALRWLETNRPDPPPRPGLVHGDFRLGNLLVGDGRLTGVLDWELAHLGDPHEDLAYAMLAVWRFGRPDRAALGLGSEDEWVAAYEAAGGVPVDRARLRYWLVHRTCWWALGCLRMAAMWRIGQDRSLERVVIARRAAEQELDLLRLLESEAPEAERARPLPPSEAVPEPQGDASVGEIAIAVGEWLATLKPRMEGHDRFQLAVARNALGIVARDGAAPDPRDRALSDLLVAGAADLSQSGLLARLKRAALDRCAADSPKYPPLALARAAWEGEH